MSAQKERKLEDEVPTGRVGQYNKDKNYGFIKDTISGEKYFIHVTYAFPEINEGIIVSFELDSGDRGTTAITFKLVQL